MYISKFISPLFHANVFVSSLFNKRNPMKNQKKNKILIKAAAAAAVVKFEFDIENV